MIPTRVQEAFPSASSDGHEEDLYLSKPLVAKIWRQEGRINKMHSTPNWLRLKN